MNFGKAIEELKNGNKVAREGWNGKGMWLVLVNSNDSVDGINVVPYVALKTPANVLQAWNASQADALADDWNIVE